MNAFIKLAMIVAILATITPRPAASATFVGAFILYGNYHARQAAYISVGYTTYGGTIYGDGRIVMPSGIVYYPNPYGRYPWGAYAYYSPRVVVYHYDYGRSGRWDRTGWHGHGHAYGHYKFKDHGDHGDHGLGHGHDDR